MHSVVVIEYTEPKEYHELLNRQEARDSRHRQHLLCSSLSNDKLIQIFYKLESMLRKLVRIGRNFALLDEGSEAQACKLETFRILPHASKHISPGS